MNLLLSQSKMVNFDYQSPTAILILKHKLAFKDANITIDRWLANHPQESRQTLSELLQSGKVLFKDDKLCDLPQLSAKEAELLVQEIQNSQIFEVKDRWYNLKKYPQCFIGSELVDWFEQNKQVLTEEAVALGQNLLKYRLIYHVHNDHDFKNEFLFYRFSTSFSK